MLVLSRKRNKSIIINNNIRVIVVEIRGDKVRLGITAPREIPVHREEVQDAINEEKSSKQLILTDHILNLKESKDAQANHK